MHLIRQKISRWCVAYVLGASSFLVLVSHAHAVTSDLGQGTGSGNITGGNQLNNPLKAGSLTEFLVLILNALQLIIFPFVVLFLVYGAFKFITAQGNEEKLKEAKRTFLWVLVGALLVLGAEVVARAIDATVKTLGA